MNLQGGCQWLWRFEGWKKTMAMQIKVAYELGNVLGWGSSNQNRGRLMKVKIELQNLYKF